MHKSEKEPSSLLAAVVAGVLIAVIPASLGYAFSYVDGLRKDDLAFTNQQIEKLYGPLYALTQANDVTWNHFSASNWPSKKLYYFDPKQPPSADQVSQWRVWMKTVFQPLNLEIERTIIQNSQLIVGNQLPTTFQEAIAQTEGYKAVISDWADTDKNNVENYRSSSKNTVTGLNYPSNIVDCVKGTYVMLKERQAQLQRSRLGSFWLSAIRPIDSCNAESP